MNQIQSYLSSTEYVYKQLFDIQHKVNNERLRNACISVLEKEYKNHPKHIHNIDSFYDSIISNKNKHNAWRGKIQSIYNHYGFDSKQKKIFVKLILKYLQKEVEEDFVEGWGIHDYIDDYREYDDEWKSDTESTVILDENSEQEKNEFVAVVYDKNNNVIKDPPHGWATELYI